MILTRRPWLQLAGGVAGVTIASPAVAKVAADDLPKPIRCHEDIITINEDGCANPTRWSESPEDPAVV